MRIVSCPLCGDLEYQHVVSTRNYVHPTPEKEFFSICRCKSCGLLYTNPCPSEDEIGHYYKDYSLHQCGTINPRPSSQFITSQRRIAPKKFNRILGSYATFLPDLPKDSTVLEIGCSTGKFLNTLRNRGWILRGIEPNESAAMYARDVLKLDVIAGTLEKATLDSESFDLIYGWHVFEHFANPLQSLAKIRHILRPGGYLCLSMPNAGALERNLFGKYWSAYEPPIHYCHYSPITIREMLYKGGFTHITIHYQRNVINILQSMGALIEEKSFSKTLSTYLLRFGENPTRLHRVTNLLTYPIAITLGDIGQGGRITVICRKPQ